MCRRRTGRSGCRCSRAYRTFSGVAYLVETGLWRPVHVVDARLESGQGRLVVRVEEQQAGDVLLTRGELHRAAVEVGLRLLVDRRPWLLAGVERRLRGRDPRLDAELAVEHGQAGSEGLV